ncbi:C10 family peptidase [Prevotella sp. tf2-5]|uniref:C10 family peptidase n=1 Tax=Prevotella sp. tf2-5 TaxID=1761889 RepID=UPI0008F0CD10|nr:C10 family peptidase [Prevotella sp. tf2-5]SFO52451.1 Peptidase C10 family protein [Prevotella sp. tf2-5]
MMRNLVLLLTMLATGLLVKAGEVTEQQALSKAQQFFNSHRTVQGTRRASAVTATSLKLVYVGAMPGSSETVNVHTRRASGSNESPVSPCFYVYNADDNSGFVIISADDAADPVIGYSFSGSFDPDDIPDGLQFMLNRYAKQIASLRTSGNKGATRRAPEAGSIVVDKLLSTTWGQGYPYNSKVHGLPAGCTNTALAQIINYYRYPKTIKKESPTSIPYYRGGNFPLATIPVDGHTSIYDYSSFKDSYGSLGTISTTEAEKIGSFFLDISTGTYSKSGTASLAGLPSLIEFYYEILGYDPFAYFYLIANAAHYEEEGRQILCKELDNGRPVFAGAPGRLGNHAFVLDGYANDGSFHVNWGWAGKSDGWFKMYVSNDVGYLEDENNFIITYIGFAPPADKVHPVVREYQKELDCDITETLVPGSQQTFESKFTVTNVEYGVDSVGLAIMDGSKISRIISKSVPIDTYVDYGVLTGKGTNDVGEEYTDYITMRKDLKGIKTTFYVPENNTSEDITCQLAMVYLAEGKWQLPNKYPSSLSDTPVLAEPLTIKVAPKGVFSMKYGVGQMTSVSLDPEENPFAYETDTILVNGSFQPVTTHTLSNCQNVKMWFKLENDEQGIPFHGDVKFEMIRHEDQKTVFSTVLEDVYVSTRGGMNQPEFDVTIDNLPPGTYFPRAEGKIYIRKDGEQTFELLTENKFMDFSFSAGLNVWEGYKVLDKEAAEEIAAPYITKFWWTADDDRPWDINNVEWGGHPEGIASGFKHYLYPKCQSGYNVTVHNPSSKSKRIALLFTNFPGTDTQYHPATDTLQMVEKVLAPKETYTYTNKFESKKPGDQLYLHAEYQGLDEHLLWFKPGVYELMARAHSGSEEEGVYKDKAHAVYLGDSEKGIAKGLGYLDQDRYFRGGAYRFYADTVETKHYEQFPNFRFGSFDSYYSDYTDSLVVNYKNDIWYSINGYDEWETPDVHFSFSFEDELGRYITPPPVDSTITEIYDADKKLLYITRVQSYGSKDEKSARGVFWNASCNVPRPMGKCYMKLYFKVLEHVYPLLGDNEFIPVMALDSVGIDEYKLTHDSQYRMHVAGEIYDFKVDDNVLVRGATTDLKYCIKNNSPSYVFNGTIAVYSEKNHDGEVLAANTKLSDDIPISINPYATAYGAIPVSIPTDFDVNDPDVDLYVVATDEYGNQKTVDDGFNLKGVFSIPVVDNQVIVSVLPSECEYGETVVPEIRVSGGCPGKTFEWTTPPTIECTANADSPAGVYEVYVSGGEGNIPISDYRGNIMKIKPAKATIKPRDVTRETGEDNPALTYDITGLKNGDTEEVLLFKPELVCEAISDSKAGTYPITIKNAIKAVNYDFTVEEGIMTVEAPADPGIAQIIVGNYSREYGDDNPVFQIVINPQQTATDTLDVNGRHHYAAAGSTEPEWEEMPTITIEATKTSKPGTYPISVTGGKLKGYNGFEIIEPGMLTVKKANLQVIARDTTLRYREAWKPEYFEYIGFKNGENPSVLDTAPTPDYYQLLDDDGRIKTLVHNQVYNPTGGDDDCYHLVFPQQEEFSSLRWCYGYLNVVPDTIQFSTGPLLTSTYGDVNGPLLPDVTAYDQFPATELPEGYAVYQVRTKDGSWVIPINDRLDAGDHLLQDDTLFVHIGLDTEEARNASYLGDAGYVAYYIPTLRVKPAELWVHASTATWWAVNWFNMHDEVKFSYSGFQWDDNESVITQEPTWRLADGEIPLPGNHQMVIDQEAKAKNYTFNYDLGSILINKASPATYFSQFDNEYDGELKWKDDMEFLNTYVGGTDVLRIEDYGIFGCIEKIFPGRYDDYWNTNGRFSKQYDYLNDFSLGYDKDTGVSTVTYEKEGDCYLGLRLNLPAELFDYANNVYISKDVHVKRQGIELTFPAGQQWQTFVSEMPCKLSEGSNARVYAVSSVDDENVYLEEYPDGIPANCMVLVGLDSKPLEPTTITLDYYEQASSIPTLLMGGISETTGLTPYRTYVLYNDEFVLNSGTSVAAGRGYLAKTSAEARQYLDIVIDGEVTSVRKPTYIPGSTDTWYDLNGRKLNGAPSKKGVYLRNKRKVTIK